MNMEKMYVCLLFFITFAGSVASMDHIVGGSQGWAYTSNPTYYQDWVKPRTFGVGDKLVFPFRTGVYNVIEVNKDEFNACTQHSPIEMYAKGPLVLNLTEPGERFFYDGVGTHCEAGTKIAIKVGNGPGSSGMNFTKMSDSATGGAATPAAAPSSSGASIPEFGLVGAGLVALVVSLLL
ncbi:hypothetical protein Sjap_021070 [Stephania japonica]|uniref:Phytocyanin domain-containing protein n=1 Tax=Stephania japonica TaxID=461633 RepID=A0AAP0I0S9_9MAGN